jgi:WD40 repeat protein
MQRVLVLCATIVSFSTARGADIREQVRIEGAFGIELQPSLRSAAFSPDGKILVTASTAGAAIIFGGGRTIFWDPATGKQLGALDGGDNVGALAATPPGRTLAHGNSLGALAFSPDGRTLAGAGTGTERDVCLWDVQTRKLTGRLNGSQYVSLMTFSADGTMLATECGGAGDVQIWGVKAEKVVATLKAQSKGAWALAFSGDGKSLAVGYGDGRIRVWDVGAERETAVLGGHANGVLALAFEPGDRTVLSAGVDKTVRRWDLTTGKAMIVTATATTRLKDAAQPYRLAFGPDLATLAMADLDGGLTVWDTKTGARVSNLNAKLRPGAFAFSTDGKWLAAEPGEDKGKTGSRSIQVWAVGKPADK